MKFLMEKSTAKTIGLFERVSLRTTDAVIVTSCYAPEYGFIKSTFSGNKTIKSL